MCMEDLESAINKNNLPVHIAVIMDGNGRWAQKQNQERIFGHQHGIPAVRNICEACAETGIKYLTLYTFSKENWGRPKQEVDMLMQLLAQTMLNEEKTLTDNNIRFQTIGDTDQLNPELQNSLNYLKQITQQNTRMTLYLALNYSSRWEMVNAVKNIALAVKENRMSVDGIDEQTISNSLLTSGMPDPDLLIRTSGELRISNFLLWQIAYSELYFTDVLWPDFSKEDLYKAVIDYQKRQRRFGKTGLQIEKK